MFCLHSFCAQCIQRKSFRILKFKTCTNHSLGGNLIFAHQLWFTLMLLAMSSFFATLYIALEWKVLVIANCQVFQFRIHFIYSIWFRQTVAHGETWTCRSICFTSFIFLFSPLPRRLWMALQHIFFSAADVHIWQYSLRTPILRGNHM